MIFRKKGQAAMEFLMTYGWALLVVLIAIVALAFFGLLNPSRFLPEKCEIAPGITCLGFNAVHDSNGANSKVTIILSNGIGRTMRDVQVNVTNCNNEGGEISDQHPILAEGATHNFVISDCTDLVANTRFSSDLVVNYTTLVDNTVLTHSRTGFLVVQVN